MKNNMIKKIIALTAAICVILAFAGCSSDKKDDKKEKASTSATDAPAKKDTKSNEAPADSSAAPSDTQGSAQTVTPTPAPAPEDTKYGNAEIYTNDNGKPAAKTESGTEVELSSENMQKLFEEYEKERDSGSEKEQELLDQIQLFLEASPNVQETN